ncbi:VLTF3-like transcription factor [Pandoravirus inopinatum]|uniref:VLTF3-like transcription factor n=1 Tax=Pandoravirus inopinatum TaxID=1605721 RepID=A0A0B5J8G1_9VIRU|nr:VLTF3-like transcription factor [Pandoravirus inopinatum]AJF98185.1 VLTF3-like transcription factor [Pandoravirus inopinatum]
MPHWRDGGRWPTSEHARALPFRPRDRAQRPPCKIGADVTSATVHPLWKGNRQKRRAKHLASLSLFFPFFSFFTVNQLQIGGGGGGGEEKKENANEKTGAADGWARAQKRRGVFPKDATSKRDRTPCALSKKARSHAAPDGETARGEKRPLARGMGGGATAGPGICDRSHDNHTEHTDAILDRPDPPLLGTHARFYFYHHALGAVVTATAARSALQCARTKGKKKADARRERVHDKRKREGGEPTRPIDGAHCRQAKKKRRAQVPKEAVPFFLPRATAV